MHRVDSPLTVMDLAPDTDAAAFVAPSALIAGDVALTSGVSVWFQAILRAERARISIGTDTNVQDGCIIHSDSGFPVVVGERVTIGHRAVLHGCTIGDDVLVGAGAIILNGATVGDGSTIAAGAVVPPGFDVVAGAVVGGVPAEPLKSDSGPIPHWNVEEYRELADCYRIALEPR